VTPPRGRGTAPGTEAPHGTQSIQRAIAVLRYFSDHDGEHGPPAVAEALDLSAGTVMRIMKALASAGLLTRNRLTDSFYLGSGAVLLGQAAQRAFGLDRALPILEQVNTETQESVNLVVREGRESVVMLRVQCTLPLRFEQRSGARFPLYTTASGKAILAFSPDAASYVESLPARLSKLTPHTLETPQALARQLTQVHRRGYSIDAEENVEGVRCVGAPIVDPAGRAHAALVIQVPTVRMTRDRERELGHLAVQAAREVSRTVPVNRTMSH
jgi:IclR family acetate operon transcriptional repressor